MNARERVRMGKLQAKLRDMENMARQNEAEGRRIGNLTGASMARGQADAFMFAAQELDGMLPRKEGGDGQEE